MRNGNGAAPSPVVLLESDDVKPGGSRSASNSNGFFSDVFACLDDVSMAPARKQHADAGHGDDDFWKTFLAPYGNDDDRRAAASGRGGEAPVSSRVTYEDYMARADDGSGGPRQRGDDWEWSLRREGVRQLLAANNTARRDEPSSAAAAPAGDPAHLPFLHPPQQVGVRVRIAAFGRTTRTTRTTTSRERGTSRGRWMGGGTIGGCATCPRACEDTGVGRNERRSHTPARRVIREARDDEARGGGRPGASALVRSSP